MATSSKTRVVVAHDYAVVAAGIASTLGREPDLDVAIRSSLAHRTEADIVIGSCREAVKLVCESLTSFGRPPKIVMVTTQESEAEIREAMDAGIHCCLSIDCAEGELLAAVRNVVRTDCHVLPTKVRSKISAVLPNPPSRGGLAPGALRRVREYIEAHLDEQILLKTLAQIAGFSVYHFARAFKQSVGVPPHRFVAERRAAKAADLIRCTDRSLSEIALSVGCSDQSHLTTLFRRCFDETPSAFRRASRSKENGARLR